MNWLAATRSEWLFRAAITINLLAFVAWCMDESGPGWGSVHDFCITALIFGSPIILFACGYCAWTARRRRHWLPLLIMLAGLWAIAKIIILMVLFGLLLLGGEH